MSSNSVEFELGMSEVVLIKARGKRIVINKDIYDLVPEARKDDFMVIVRDSVKSYNGLVSLVKSQGNNPSYLKIKNYVLDLRLHRFLDDLGIIKFEDYSRGYSMDELGVEPRDIKGKKERSSKSRLIKSSGDPAMVETGSELVSDIDASLDLSEVSELYDTYSADLLDDSGDLSSSINDLEVYEESLDVDDSMFSPSIGLGGLDCGILDDASVSVSNSYSEYVESRESSISKGGIDSSSLFLGSGDIITDEILESMFDKGKGAETSEGDIVKVDEDSLADQFFNMASK